MAKAKTKKAIPANTELTKALRTRQPFSADSLQKLAGLMDKGRVLSMADDLAHYSGQFLPRTLKKKKVVKDYRINPYVLITAASLMNLSGTALARFLSDTKLYTGLETSFGKQIEKVFAGFYPAAAPANSRWIDPPEKLAESTALFGLSKEERAAKRTHSVWREIDKSVVVGKRRYLVTIKSGPQCINDTQVAAMHRAITSHNNKWFENTKQTYPDVEQLDIVLGLTYGTNATTNSKENQLLVKLRADGFAEIDRIASPGVLVDPSGNIRVYRVIGAEFWSFIGCPNDPRSADATFLEVLVALTIGMASEKARTVLASAVEEKLKSLEESIAAIRMTVKGESVFPDWVRDTLSDNERTWLSLGLSAFFDQGL